METRYLVFASRRFRGPRYSQSETLQRATAASLVSSLLLLSFLRNRRRVADMALVMCQSDRQGLLLLGTEAGSVGPSSGLREVVRLSSDKTRWGHSLLN